MPYTIPPDTRAIGTGNPPVDMNNVADVLTGSGLSCNILNTAFAGGADPSGSALSDAALAAAVAAAYAGGPGSTVWIPAGTYKLSQAVACGGGWPGSITIAGQGWDSQLFMANGSNAYIFDFGSGGNPLYTPGLEIRDLYLNCNGANQSSAGGGIYARGAIWCVFDRLWIETPWGEGIRFYQDGTGNYGHHNTIQNCLFRDGRNSAGGNGLAAKVQSCDENLFTGCTFQDCGNTSGASNGQVYDTGAGLSTYSGCHFVGGASGVPFVNSDSSPGRLLFTGCQFDSPNGGDMLVLRGPGHVVTGCQFVNVGNGLSSGQASGVHLYGSTGSVVEACSFGASTAFATAVLEDNGATGNSIGLNSYTGTWLNNAPVVLAGAGIQLSPSIVVSPVTAQALSNGTTVTMSASFGAIPVTATGNVTGIILATAVNSGQQVTVINRSAFTVTFAAAGTSNVADGTADVIPALAARTFTWDTSTARWYRSV